MVAGVRAKRRRKGEGVDPHRGAVMSWRRAREAARLRQRGGEMRIGVVPEGPLERVLLATGAVPTPLLETMIAMMLARTLMVGCKLGVFEALAAGALDVEAVAKQTGTEARA